MKVFINKCSYYGESVDKLMICLKLSMRIFCVIKADSAASRRSILVLMNNWLLLVWYDYEK